MAAVKTLDYCPTTLPEVIVERKKLQKKRGIEKHLEKPSQKKSQSELMKDAKKAKKSPKERTKNSKTVKSDAQTTLSKDNRQKLLIVKKRRKNSESNKTEAIHNERISIGISNKKVQTAVQQSVNCENTEKTEKTERKLSDEERKKSISIMAATFDPITPIEEQSSMFDVTYPTEGHNVGGRSLFKRRNSLSLYKKGYQPGQSLTYKYGSKGKNKMKTEFHLSFNESTASFIGGSIGFLEMSSGLICKPPGPKSDFHISLDESTDNNITANAIKNTIFNKNNDWNLLETASVHTPKDTPASVHTLKDEPASIHTPKDEPASIHTPEEEPALTSSSNNQIPVMFANYEDPVRDTVVPTTDENNSEVKTPCNTSKENDNDLIISSPHASGRSPHASGRSSPHASGRSSTKLSFLFNEHTGFICKNCFSPACRHIQNISRLAKSKEKEVSPSKGKKKRRKKKTHQQDENIEKNDEYEEKEHDTEYYRQDILEIELKANKEQFNDSKLTEKETEKDSLDRLSFSSFSCSSSSDDKDSSSSEELGEAKTIRNEIETAMDNLMSQLELKVQNIADLSDLMKLIKIRDIYHSYKIEDASGESGPQSPQGPQTYPSFELDVTFHDDIDDELFALAGDETIRSEENRKEHIDKQFELSCNELRCTPPVVQNGSLSIITEPTRSVDSITNMQNIRPVSSESLCYDSDYDDASYLNGCLSKTQTSYEKLDVASNTYYSNYDSINIFETPSTPPLTASSPTNNSCDNLYVKQDKRKSSLQPMSDLETVFETEEIHQSPAASISPVAGLDQSPAVSISPVEGLDQSPAVTISPVEGLDDILQTVENILTKKLSCPPESDLSNLKQDGAEVVTRNETTITQNDSNVEQSVTNLEHIVEEDTFIDEIESGNKSDNKKPLIDRNEDEMFIKQVSNSEETIDENTPVHKQVKVITYSDLSVSELKALAKKHLTMHSIATSKGSPQTSDTSTPEIKNELLENYNKLIADEKLQITLQEKRKLYLNSEFFSKHVTDSVDEFLPEDEEVDRINKNIPVNPDNIQDSLLTEVLTVEKDENTSSQNINEVMDDSNNKNNALSEIDENKNMNDVQSKNVTNKVVHTYKHIDLSNLDESSRQISKNIELLSKINENTNTDKEASSEFTNVIDNEDIVNDASSELAKINENEDVKNEISTEPAKINENKSTDKVRTKNDKKKSGIHIQTY